MTFINANPVVTLTLILAVACFFAVWSLQEPK